MNKYYFLILLSIFAIFGCKSDDKTITSKCNLIKNLSLYSTELQINLLDSEACEDFLKSSKVSITYEPSELRSLLQNYINNSECNPAIYKTSEVSVINDLSLRETQGSFVNEEYVYRMYVSFAYYLAKSIHHSSEGDYTAAHESFSKALDLENKMSKIIDQDFLLAHYFRNIDALCSVVIYFSEDHEIMANKIINSDEWKRFISTPYQIGFEKYIIARLCYFDSLDQNNSNYKKVHESAQKLAEKIIVNNNNYNLKDSDLEWMLENDDNIIKTLGFESWIFMESFLKRKVAHLYLSAAKSKLESGIYPEYLKVKFDDTNAPYKYELKDKFPVIYFKLDGTEYRKFQSDQGIGTELKVELKSLK